MDTQEAIEAFLQAKRDRGLSPRTITGYAQRLARFALTHPELPTEPEPIEAYCARFTNADTHDTHWRTITTLYRWLVKRRKLPTEHNPMQYAERPLLERTVPRAFTKAELAQIFAYPHPSPVRLFLRLLFRCGLRIGEAWSLQPEALRDETIVVSGKTGQREIPCDPDFIIALRFTLPWPWTSVASAGHAVTKGIRRSGVTGRRASAHSLRHSFARFYHGDSLNLQGILWGRASKQINRYRPYEVHRTMEEYQGQDWVA